MGEKINTIDKARKILLEKEQDLKSLLSLEGENMEVSLKSKLQQAAVITGAMIAGYSAYRLTRSKDKSIKKNDEHIPVQRASSGIVSALVGIAAKSAIAYIKYKIEDESKKNI